MQFDSGVSQDIIQVIQALVLAFVAAPLIIRQLYRIRKPTEPGRRHRLQQRVGKVGA